MITADIILAIAPGCPHCPNVMQTLQDMVKQGDIASVQIINIAVDNSFAEQHGIRSVPWMKIGQFVLTGVQSKQVMLEWLEKSKTNEGARNYLVESLTSGELDAALQAIQQTPELIDNVIALIADDATNINARIGIGAIIETLQEQDTLKRLLPGLLSLLQHKSARVRGDAAHFLSFIHSTEAIPALQSLKDDPSEEVREIASESLETLQTLE